MPVPYHLDESDSDSIVSSEDAASYTELMPMTTSSATDEVKLGLRNAIKTRRVAQGLDGMPHLEAKRPKLEALSNEEEEKRRVRRERNKVAAFKCRLRRKEHMQKLQDESDDLNADNSSLERELVALKAQKEELEKMFRSHNCVLKDTTSKENTTTEQSSDAKSPQSCSTEVAKSNEPSTPTSPMAESVNA
ncbi:bZIP Maf transcription factor [Desmophyllum pertusum]|uniref:BZIP Maf transcription factor n=1 Tax=Desmophyllum pertusum TaxID=174260 RepID=A0A9W9Z3E7_9CNID|nr:bZIP Maf transcription factor [Desmophyllum pertusum]